MSEKDHAALASTEHTGVGRSLLRQSVSTQFEMRGGGRKGTGKFGYHGSSRKKYLTRGRFVGGLCC